MRFEKINKNNIEELYNINKCLAIEEGQKDLFKASLNNYTKGFIDSSPIVHGIICYQDNEIIGFCIFYYKFATYLGNKVLFIEDIYLKITFRSEENKMELLKYMIKKAFKDDCERIEMRVLNNFNFGIELIKEQGFKKITKWATYRLERNV